MLAGLSTLGVKFSYAPETTAGTKPTAFTLLHRINQIGGINLEQEKIDASALEDAISRYVSGRSDSGGSFPVTVNMTNETIAEWKEVIAAYNSGKAAGKRIWFEVSHPDLTDGFFIVAQPPQKIPMPETSQNGLWTVEMPLTIEEYVGLDKAITPTEKKAA